METQDKQAKLNVELKPQDLKENLTLEVVIRYRDCLRQCNNGQLPEWNNRIDCRILVPSEKYAINIDALEVHQVRGLSLLISTLKEMITLTRHSIYFNAKNDYDKQYLEDDVSKPPFEKLNNDYNKLIELLRFLKSCEYEIRKAQKTKRLDDDFIKVCQEQSGESYCELTDNFYEMLSDLEETFEKISFLLLKNKLLNPLIEQGQKKLKSNELF